MRKVLGALALSFAVAMGAAPGAAQETEGVYIIYDSSNSMWGELPDRSRKYEAARVAMRDLVGQDFSGRDVALRMYGHRRKDDCSDSELVVPFSPAGAVRNNILSAMETVRPRGRTPIDLSLRQALADFGDRAGSIILISDGIESCDADPCALVRAWKDRNVAISVYVVGLGLQGRERAAMQCIADAAGTPYRDAFSTGELAESLNETVRDVIAEAPSLPVQPGTPAPEPQATVPEFRLVVETEDGARQRGAGTLTPVGGGEPITVETFKRYTPEPGDYVLTAGIQTVGGAVYQPVTMNVTVADQGETRETIVPPRPPQASAAFSMEGDAIRATVVTVYRDGEKLGSFKGDATAFVPEGALEFRAQPAGTSQEMSVAETFAAGDAKTIRFDADIEVRLTVVATAMGTGERLRGKPNTVLLADGVEAHTINNSSGGLVRPGAYTVLIDDGLNHFETEIVVTVDPVQVLEIEAPAGSLTVTYQDASGAVEDAKRVFLTREGGRRTVRQSAEPIALTPGKYTLTGWPAASGYPAQELEIAAGDNVAITLRATK